MTELEVPDLGSKHLVAHVADRVLHLRVDRVAKRNAFTQDMYRGIKRGPTSPVGMSIVASASPTNRTSRSSMWIAECPAVWPGV